MEISNARSVRHRQIEHIHSFAIGCLDSRVGALLMNFEICSRFKNTDQCLKLQSCATGERAACLVGVHPSQGQTATPFMQYHIIPMGIMDINPSVEGLTAQPYVFKGGALLTLSTAPSPQ